MTMMSYVACGVYPVYEPRTFLFPSGFGTLGFSLPAAIGAKIGRPEAGVVAVVGDGGFQYTMGDLGCAVQERLGLPIVIFNDSTYSAVKHAQMEERGGRYLAVDLINPDYVKLADAYGIPGVRANSPEELEREVKLAFERDCRPSSTSPSPRGFSAGAEVTLSPTCHSEQSEESLPWGPITRSPERQILILGDARFDPQDLSTRRGCTIAIAALAIPSTSNTRPSQSQPSTPYTSSTCVPVVAEVTTI